MSSRKSVERANKLFKAMEIILQHKLNQLKFNTKIKAVVTSVNGDGTVNVTINGEAKDNVKVRPGLTVNVNDVVWLELPNNQLKDAFVDMIV